MVEGDDHAHELGTAQLLDDPEKAAVSSVLQKSIGQVQAARYADHVDALRAMPREWVEAGATTDRTLTLTGDKLATMKADLESVVARWQQASAAHSASARNEDDNAADADRANGAKPVFVVYQAYRRP